MKNLSKDTMEHATKPGMDVQLIVAHMAASADPLQHGSGLIGSKVGPCAFGNQAADGVGAFVVQKLAHL